MNSIALYGKGGVGKTTIAGHLASAFRQSGETPALIGCSPKSDSTWFLLGEYCRPTVLEQIQAGKITRPGIDECLKFDRRGIACIETGGPEPAAGCAGRGISFALGMLKKMDTLKRAGVTFPIYDVIADVVCGGFSEPFRAGYVSRIYLVTTAEMMSLYAVNNICNAVKNMQAGGAAVKIGGLIHNCRDISDEKRIVERFAERLNLNIAGVIPYEPLVKRTAEEHFLMTERYPDSDYSHAMLTLAENVRDEKFSDCNPMPVGESISVISEIIAGKKLRNAEVKTEDVSVENAPRAAEGVCRKIAIYGKGGIGKSTVTSNLSAACAEFGERVMQIGCDPKHDSVALLAGKMIPTVLDVMDKQPAADRNYIYRGYGGVYCVESGGPSAGSGCSGKGVYSALEFLEKNDVFRRLSISMALFDILGDVVCGGFAQPLRSGLCHEIYIVTTSEPLSLLVVNNLLKACVNMRREGIEVSVNGLIQNRYESSADNELIQSYARDVNVPIIAAIPNSQTIREAEMHRQTVLQYAPNDRICTEFRTLAENIRHSAELNFTYQPLPDFSDILALGRSAAKKN